MKLFNKTMAVVLPTLVLTSSFAVAGEPYAIKCSKNKTTLFAASITNSADKTSTEPRVMSVRLAGAESFADTIDLKTLKSLENAAGTSFIVKDKNSGRSAKIIINAGSSGDQEVIRTSGSVEMLDSGLKYDGLTCAIVLRLEE